MYVTPRKLLQNATLWRASPNGFGGDSFSAPEAVMCKWEERAVVFVSPADRKEHISKAVVFLDRQVSTGDWLYLGVSTVSDPAGLTGAYKVRDYTQLTDLNNIKVIRMAKL